MRVWTPAEGISIVKIKDIVLKFQIDIFLSRDAMATFLIWINSTIETI